MFTSQGYKGETMGKIYVGDIGTEILAAPGLDITGATVSLAVLKPGATTEVTWTATVYTDGDGVQHVRRTTAVGDLDVAGPYRLQPVIALADGTWAGRGETDEFRVFDKQK